MNTKCVLGLLSAVGMAGCATSEGAGAAAARAPAAQAPLSASGSPCRVTGEARVVASHVYVPAGVEASLDDGRATIRFAPSKASCAVARALPTSGRFVTDGTAGECPGDARDVVATSEGETIIARESRPDGRAPHIELGVVVHDVPSLVGFSARDPDRVVERAFAPPQASSSGEKNPGLAPLPGERFLLLWVDGDSEGHSLRAQPVADWGTPVGPAFDLSPSDVSVIGRPSAAVGPDGRGLVAFLASSVSGFDVLATPIACEGR
jgi:hypothetical protein